MTLTVGSLFSGIGGLDLGLERAGMKVIWQSEIDPYACKVLEKHWPEVPNYGNIKEIDWSRVVRPDVICGGYPCQPFSTAGKRQGENDPRHLWPWVREAISQLRPRYAVLENVRGHLTMGGTTVIGELAAIGYDAEWRVVSAASVGANHRRDRIIIVAYPNSSHATDGRQREAVPSQNRSWRNDRGRSRGDTGQIGMGSTRQIASDVADANKQGSQRRPEAALPQRQTANGHAGQSSSPLADAYDAGSGTPRSSLERKGSQSQPERQHSQHGVSRRSAEMANTNSSGCVHSRAQVFSTDTRLKALSQLAISSWWAIEPNVGRVANGVPHRVDRLRGLGNAVVPQVAEVIGRLVMAHAHN